MRQHLEPLAAILASRPEPTSLVGMSQRRRRQLLGAELARLRKAGVPVAFEGDAVLCYRIGWCLGACEYCAGERGVRQCKARERPWGKGATFYDAISEAQGVDPIHDRQCVFCRPCSVAILSRQMRTPMPPRSCADGSGVLMMKNRRQEGGTARFSWEPQRHYAVDAQPATFDLRSTELVGEFESIVRFWHHIESHSDPGSIQVPRRIGRYMGIDRPEIIGTARGGMVRVVWVGAKSPTQYFLMREARAAILEARRDVLAELFAPPTGRETLGVLETQEEARKRG